MSPGTAPVSLILRGKDLISDLLRHRDLLTIGRHSVYAILATTTLLVAEKLVVYPFLVREAGYETFGTLLLSRYWVGLPATLITVGLYSSLLRKYGKSSRMELRQLFIASGIIATVFLGGAFAVSAFGGDMLRSLSGSSLTIAYIQQFLLLGWISALVAIMLTRFRAAKQLGWFYSLQALMGALCVLVIPIFLLFGPAFIPAGFVFAAALTGLVAAVILGPKIVSPSRLSARSFRALLRDLWPLGLAPSLLNLSRVLDKLIVGSFLGVVATGHYFALTSVALLPIIPVESLAGVLLAHLVGKDKSPLTDVQNKKAALLFSATVSVGILFAGLVVGKPVTNWLYGQGTFEIAPFVFYAVLAGAAVSTAGILFTPFLIMYHPSATLAIVNAISAAATAGFALVAIGAFGASLQAISIAAATGLAFRGLLCIWIGLRTDERSISPHKTGRQENMA